MIFRYRTAVYHTRLSYERSQHRHWAAHTMIVSSALLLPNDAGVHERGRLRVLFISYNLGVRPYNLSAIILQGTAHFRPLDAGRWPLRIGHWTPDTLDRPLEVELFMIVGFAEEQCLVRSCVLTSSSPFITIREEAERRNVITSMCAVGSQGHCSSTRDQIGSLLSDHGRPLSIGSLYIHDTAWPLALRSRPKKLACHAVYALVHGRRRRYSGLKQDIFIYPSAAADVGQAR